MNTKTKALLIGGLVGALVGALAGFLYFNNNVIVDEEGNELLDAPTPATSLRFGLGALGLLRQISE